MKKHFTKKTFIRIVACILLLLFIPATALADFKAKVFSSGMRVYSRSSTSNQYYLGSLKKGTSFTVLKVTGDWCKISYKGYTGYAQVKDIKSEVKTTVYTNRIATVRATASSNGKVLCKLTADYPLYLVGASGKYYLVETVDGKGIGYVSKSHLSADRVNHMDVASKYKGTYSSSGSSTTIPTSVKSKQFALASTMSKSNFIEYMLYGAQSRLGCAYNKYGNNNTTFSNPGFVKSVYALLGYKLPSTAKNIGHNSGIGFVSRSELKRGDIVCFDMEGNDDHLVDHVGIYLGKGYFMHASATAGMVIVTSMSSKSSYYYKTFCWGRRIIK